MCLPVSGGTRTLPVFLWFLIFIFFLTTGLSHALTEGTWVSNGTETSTAPPGEISLGLGSWVRDGYHGYYHSDDFSDSSGWAIEGDFHSTTTMIMNQEFSPENELLKTTCKEIWTGGTLTIPAWSSDPIPNYKAEVTWDIINDTQQTIDNIKWNAVQYYTDPVDMNTYELDWNFDFDEDPEKRGTYHWEGTMTSIRVEATIDNDQDGIGDTEEFGFYGDDPEYDGNNDQIADSEQSNVTSLKTADNKSYVTLETLLDETLASVESIDAEAYFGYDSSLDQLFLTGLYDFEISDLGDDNAVALTIILPEIMQPTTYYKFGPTEPGKEAEWYEFLYNNTTGVGAVIEGNIITLHLKDGFLGDDDFTANGVIYDIGGPGFGPQPVPEPCTIFLLGSGLIGIAGFRRKRRKP